MPGAEAPRPDGAESKSESNRFASWIQKTQRCARRKLLKESARAVTTDMWRLNITRNRRDAESANGPSIVDATH